MPKRAKARQTARRVASGSARSGQVVLGDLLWRIDRLERQVKRLTELVRDHAEDADRLVKIVAEDHEMLRRDLLLEQQARLRRRKGARGRRPPGVGLTG